MKKKHWLIAGLLAVVTFLLGLLANSIMNRSTEAQIIARGGNDLPQQECKNELFDRSILVNTLRGQQLPTLHSALGI